MPDFQSSFCPGRRRLLAGAVAFGLSGLHIVRAATATDELRLLAVCRTLFPHEFLTDEAYRAVVQKLQARLAIEPDFATLLDAGLATLPDDFAQRDQATREAALAPCVGTPFFKALRQVTAATLYQLPVTWQSLGYPGPSAGFGGYVDRPLVSLDWLPGVTA